jgi:phosphoribosylanthranilate isomerase
MKVKICGITSEEDAHMCEDLGADALGFVHYPGRNRSLSLEKICEICSTLGPLTTRVLICNPMGPNEAIHILEKSGADVLQTYSLSPVFISRVKESGIRVIRAVTLEIKQVEKFEGVADALVFEAGIPGTGTSYDYSKIPIDSCSRAIVAGGLSPFNLNEVKELRPYGVDVSSGVETIPGKKDMVLVDLFIRGCHS